MGSRDLHSTAGPELVRDHLQGEGVCAGGEPEYPLYASTSLLAILAAFSVSRCFVFCIGCCHLDDVRRDRVPVIGKVRAGMAIAMAMA